MTAVELGRLYRALDDVLGGRWEIHERLMLEVAAPRVRAPQWALNDAVIRISSPPRVTTVFASIAGEDLGGFTGDGVIVATPTGSTAYSLAAQGPVVHPQVEALVLTPICAHSFRQRPVVFPAHQALEFHLKAQRPGTEVQLCLDGQRIFPLEPGDRIGVRRAPLRLKLWQNPAVSYFSVLAEKLSWGGR